MLAVLDDAVSYFQKYFAARDKIQGRRFLSKGASIWPKTQFISS